MSNIHQFKNASPESEILLSHFYATFDIDTIVPLFYQGVIAGSEFLTYAADKLYLCLSCEFSHNLAEGANPFRVTFYNEGDAAFFYYNQDFLTHDGMTPTTYYGWNYNMQNLYFSRITVGVYTHVKFIGYRITLI